MDRTALDDLHKHLEGDVNPRDTPNVDRIPQITGAASMNLPWSAETPAQRKQRPIS